MNKALGLIGLSAKAGKIVYGTDSVIEALENKKVKLVIVATDASDKSKKNFKYYADKNDVKIVFYETSENISKAIGKKNKVVIGITDESFAGAIHKIIDGGEFIG